MPFSPATFTTERGPGAFASLGALPRRGSTSKQRRPLFHFDDDNEQDSPPDTPQNVPFPSRSQSSSPASPVQPLTPTNGPPAIKRSDSGSVILSNGRPLKSSLKSASSQSIATMDDGSSIADEDERSMSRPLHMRAQSMPSTPRVHFHDDKLATVRVFRSTGRPRSVSTNELDTETETEVEPAAYPFPRTAPQAAQALMDIDPSPARTSIIPAPNPPQESHVLIESISLPPSRPPVLRGTVLVRNVSFEKRVCIRFTLDDWTTVSEVLATYSSSLSPSANPLARQEGLTIGDLAHRQSQNWDRFAFAIRLEDYESRLADRTLWFVARYTTPGAGEWWDNNSAANYKVSFRPRAAAPVQRKAPSAAPFLASSASIPVPSLPQRTPVHALATRPGLIQRSTSSPNPPTVQTLGRLSLKHYAAPAAPAPPMPSPEERKEAPAKQLKNLVGGHFTSSASPMATPTSAPPPPPAPMQVEDGPGHVDEGFATGSEDEDIEPRKPALKGVAARRNSGSLRLDIAAPRATKPASALPSLGSRGPFSPTRSSPVPFASAIGVAQSHVTSEVTQQPTPPASGQGSPDASYAALIREWCFAQGDATATPTPTNGAVAGWGPTRSNALWVGMGG